MGKIVDYRRLLKEDFKDAPAWLDRLIFPVNMFMEQTYSLFSNLSIGDNIIGAYSNPITFTTSATYTSGDFTGISFQWRYPSIRAREMRISSIVRSDGVPIITPVTVVQWSQPQTTLVRADYIAGLANSTRYVVTLIAQ